MKILVLEGSPHKNGSSNLLADNFIKGAKESGHEVQVYDHWLNFNPGCNIYISIRHKI